jgi:preprotein translocase subunit SecA
MTGTALTEEEEFQAIYNLDIVEIPTNKPLARIDRTDAVYKNENGKNRAIINQIIACHEKGQPVLVGTVSIEKSEYLSKLLKKQGVPHNVLNAKNHEKEAEIIAQAGKLGAVTIATNMAGRGTDIMLGGNAEYLARVDLRKAGYSEEVIAEATGYADTDDEEILAARKMFAEREAAHKEVTSAEAEQVRAVGGLYILGTERHESRRIDNQLRGRAGRQGDPGESRFFISMEDDIMRLFGSERIMGMMESLGLDEDTPIDQKMLTNAIEQAQKTVESRNFQSRKSVLEYDDVMNLQRNIIYDQRRKVLDGEDIQSYVHDMIEEYVRSELQEGMGGKDYFDDTEQFEAAMKPFYALFLPRGEFVPTQQELSALTLDSTEERVMEYAEKAYAAREAELGLMENGTPLMRELERVVMLRVVDEYWMDHIDSMQELRRGIGLRAFGNTQPIDAYKQEGFDMFEAMIKGIKEEVVRRMFTVRVRREQPIERKSVAKTTGNVGGDSTATRQPVKVAKKPGRNDPCPCGKLRPNGLPMKYKDCCGRNG